MTRHDLRELVRRGLDATEGNYRLLLKVFGMPAQDYKRFMNFLAAHDCRVDFREFRNRGTELDTRPLTGHEGTIPPPARFFDHTAAASPR